MCSYIIWLWVATPNLRYSVTVESVEDPDGLKVWILQRMSVWYWKKSSWCSCLQKVTLRPCPTSWVNCWQVALHMYWMTT